MYLLYALPISGRKVCGKFSERKVAKGQKTCYNLSVSLHKSGTGTLSRAYHSGKGAIALKYKYISDSHTHSENSFDGKDSVLLLCERAAQLGLYSLTITDHCECHEYYANNVRQDIEGSVRDTLKARGVYADRLRIYTGIELGQPTQDPSAAAEALSLAEYDFVLGSLHNLRGEQDFYFLHYTADNVHDLLDRYFEELLELVKSDCFDSLAHLTYPFRYVAAEPSLRITPKDYADQIDTVLEQLAHQQKALEVNTSGLRQKIGVTLPDEAILRRFHELGGRYVTVGSDAHRWGDIASGIEDALPMLQRCGFSHFTVYQKRTPDLFPI